MRTQVTTPTQFGRRLHWRPLAATLAGLVLAATAGFAAGYVLADRGDGRTDDRTTPAQAAISVPDVAVERDAAIAAQQFDGARPLEASQPARGERLVVYIVGSETQASFLREELAWTENLALSAGNSFPTLDIIVVDSPGDEATVQAQLADLANIRAAYSAGDTTILDLR